MTDRIHDYQIYGLIDKTVRNVLNSLQIEYSTMQYLISTMVRSKLYFDLYKSVISMGIHIDSIDSDGFKMSFENYARNFTKIFQYSGKENYRHEIEMYKELLENSITEIGDLFEWTDDEKLEIRNIATGNYDRIWDEGSPNAESTGVKNY